MDVLTLRVRDGEIFGRIAGLGAVLAWVARGREFR